MKFKTPTATWCTLEINWLQENWKYNSMSVKGSVTEDACIFSKIYKIQIQVQCTLSETYGYTCSPMVVQARKYCWWFHFYYLTHCEQARGTTWYILHFPIPAFLCLPIMAVRLAFKPQCRRAFVEKECELPPSNGLLRQTLPIVAYERSFGLVRQLLLMKHTLRLNYAAISLTGIYCYKIL